MYREEKKKIVQTSQKNARKIHNNEKEKQK